MKLATIRDAAELLNVSESRLRKAVLLGEVPSMKLGTRTLVDVEAAQRVLITHEGVKIETVSEETGLTVSAIRRFIREGWMPYTKPGKAYLFDMDKVNAAIARRIREKTHKETT